MFPKRIHHHTQELHKNYSHRFQLVLLVRKKHEFYQRLRYRFAQEGLSEEVILFVIFIKLDLYKYAKISSFLLPKLWHFNVTQNGCFKVTHYSSLTLRYQINQKYDISYHFDRRISQASARCNFLLVLYLFSQKEITQMKDFSSCKDSITNMKEYLKKMEYYLLIITYLKIQYNLLYFIYFSVIIKKQAI